MAFSIGDFVKVKAGVKSPDDDSLSIAGWQGRVSDIDEDEDDYRDPVGQHHARRDASRIHQAQRNRGTWIGPRCIWVSTKSSSSPPRDSEAEAERAREALHSKYRWFDGGDEGERISAVIADTDEDGELDTWVEHLSRTLSFPFNAMVTEHLERGPLERGNKVSVQGLDGADESQGVLVNVTRGEERLVFPLCDLAVLDRKSPCYLSVKDYCVWFANR